MQYIELYIFALDLHSNSLNHFIWKRLKVTVCGRLPLSRYANTWLDHDDVSIGLYCALWPLSEKQISGLPLCNRGERILIF